MRRRGSIPPGYWVRVVDAASSRGLGGVTYARLAEIAAGMVTEGATEEAAE